jgi:hypothetical protein
MRDYKFENVVCKGKRFGFIVHNAVNFTDAKRKAVKFCLEKLKLSNSEFKTTLGYLTKNIENGETRVTPLKKEDQMGLDLSSKASKFEQKFELLYKGIINEWLN